MAASKPDVLSVDEARQLLRDSKLRCTSCRVTVLQHLSKAEMPLSHAEVADELVPAGFDKTTIYRCLTELAESELAARLDLGDHVWRFELLRESDVTHVEHPHFMCVECGKVECLHDLNVSFSQRKGVRKKTLGDITEILLKGHCAECC